jgi:DNA (cytosine-5)-methyltransferase 1
MKIICENIDHSFVDILNDPDQLELFEKDSTMNSVDLKYPRRKSRTINSTKYVLDAPNEVTSRTMKNIPSSNTKIEQIFECALVANKIIYSKPKDLIGNIEGNPDFVIPRYKIAIFCDGDFWHGKNFDQSKIKNNSEFWIAKIQNNILRDEAVTYNLEKDEWKVFRFWEHEIKQDVQVCIDKVYAYIDGRLNGINSVFTFVDLFAGIGGFRIPLEELGGKCLGFSEIDKQAIKTYKKNFFGIQNDIEVELGDITKLEKLPFNDIDLIVGGVPCQAWSVAGNMKGFDDPRGKLWHDTIRLVKQNRPKAFIFENVKGLIDPRNKKSLNLIIESFEDSGYVVKQPKLLNSYDFGLPQNRDRIFIVGIRKDLKQYLDKFSYPEPIVKDTCVGQLLNNENKKLLGGKKIFDPKEIHGDKIPFSRNRFQKSNELNDFFIFCDTRNGHTTIHSWDIIKTSEREKDICLSILKNRRKKIYGISDGNPMKFNELKKLIPNLSELELKELVKKDILKYNLSQGYDFINSKNSSGINGIYRIYLPHSRIFSTLTATGTKDMVALQSVDGSNPKEYRENFINEIVKKKKYREITAKEAGKLQGFPDWFAINEDEKCAKKQFGNAVSTSVISWLAKSVLKTGIFNIIK